jgi:DNA-binding GntR family transcriptional regulator
MGITMRPDIDNRQKRTLSEQAYTQIKLMILRREFLPGSPLVLQTLAKKLGVSRMPVIEAIRRLERDGLVEAVPQWGAYVKQWTRDEMLEAYCIRRALEGEAARYFVLRATAAEKQRLVELSEEYDSAVMSEIQDPSEVEVGRIDAELHLHVARACGFRRLYELIETSKITTTVITGLTLAILLDAATAKSYYRKLHGCHKPMVAALLGEDPEKAVCTVWQHVDTSLELIMKLEDKIQRERVPGSK